MVLGELFGVIIVSTTGTGDALSRQQLAEDLASRCRAITADQQSVIPERESDLGG